MAPNNSATNKPGMAAVSDEPDHETHSVASNGSAQSSVSSRQSFAEVVRAVPAVPARAPSPPASSSALVALPVPAPVEPPAPAGIGAPAFVAQSVPGSAKPRASGGAPVFDGPGADRAPATVGMSDQDWAALSMQEQNTILNYVTNLAPANIRAVRTSSRASTHSARSLRSSRSSRSSPTPTSARASARISARASSHSAVAHTAAPTRTVPSTSHSRAGAAQPIQATATTNRPATAPAKAQASGAPGGGGSGGSSSGNSSTSSSGSGSWASDSASAQSVGDAPLGGDGDGGPPSDDGASTVSSVSTASTASPQPLSTPTRSPAGPRLRSTDPPANSFKIVTRDKRTPLDDTLPINKVQAFAKFLSQTKPEYKGDALSSNYIRSLTDAIASPLALVAQVPQDPAEVAAIVEEWIKAGTRPNVAAALSGSIADLIRRTEPTGIPSPIDKPRAIAAQTDAMLTLAFPGGVNKQDGWSALKRIRDHYEPIARSNRTRITQGLQTYQVPPGGGAQPVSTFVGTFVELSSAAFDDSTTEQAQDQLFMYAIVTLKEDTRFATFVPSWHRDATTDVDGRPSPRPFDKLCGLLRAHARLLATQLIDRPDHTSKPRGERATQPVAVVIEHAHALAILSEQVSRPAR